MWPPVGNYTGGYYPLHRCRARCDHLSLSDTSQLPRLLFLLQLPLNNRHVCCGGNYAKVGPLVITLPCSVVVIFLPGIAILFWISIRRVDYENIVMKGT